MDLLVCNKLSRRLWALLLIAVFSISCSEDTNKYLAEADSFRRGIPSDLQHRQSVAVRSAITGDSQLLNEVRNARNTKPTLLDGVVADEVNSSCTLFRPEDYASSSQALPLLIYLHGGGWAFGSRNSCARFCMSLAQMGIAVLDVEYRLAPENPYPAAIEDVIEALRLSYLMAEAWGIDPKRISMGGDSAGGNLSLAAALKLGKTDSLRSLVLFYPVVRSYADNTSSLQEYGQGYGLDAELMDAFNEAYTMGDEQNPLISPAHATDSMLTNLPPCLFVAADRDILRDQGHEFASRLERLGNQVEYHLIPSSVHLFITVDGQPSAFQKALEFTSNYLLK